jgi:hypothetical protein
MAEAVRQVYEIFWSGLFRGRQNGKRALLIEEDADLAIG